MRLLFFVKVFKCFLKFEVVPIVLLIGVFSLQSLHAPFILFASFFIIKCVKPKGITTARFEVILLFFCARR